MKNEQYDEQAVRVLAYQFWMERGRPIGSPEVDWDRAVEWLCSDSSAATREQRPSEESLEARDAPPIESSPEKADAPPAPSGKRRRSSPGKRQTEKDGGPG